LRIHSSTGVIESVEQVSCSLAILTENTGSGRLITDIESAPAAIAPFHIDADLLHKAITSYFMSIPQRCNTLELLYFWNQSDLCVSRLMPFWYLYTWTNII